MKTVHLAFVAIISTFFTLLMVSSAFFIFDNAQAAPQTPRALLQTENSFQYISVSALAFLPVQPNTTYIRDTQRELLGLVGSDRTISQNRNVFVAPIPLPDRGQLLAMTVFGEDADNQGEVRIRLKRCDHSQGQCITLGETSSTQSYAAGRFETTRLTFLNEPVNNGIYSYLLELELTALFNSGLRVVRVEVSGPATGTVAENIESWELAGTTRSLALPNADLAQAKICTDDLSLLDNPTHYPFVVVDNQVITLGSGECVTVWGRDISVQRKPNTGPSSGTYQFLR
jgi:hypothetical protein